MAERKNLSNKTRFEVFKRDNFTCQYCGKKAPEVVLNVDHIEPVSKGGSNDLFNLITSCFECNNGKRDKKLDDSTTLDKQHEELIILNERKKQLEQMLEWKKELKDFDNKKRDVLKEYVEETLVTKITDEGVKYIDKWLKKHTIEELMEATDKAVENYFERPNDFIFSKIERIAHYTKNPVPNYVKNSRYIVGILRNRGLYYNENLVRKMTFDWEEAGKEFEEMSLAAKHAKNWTTFKNSILFVLEGLRDE